MSTEIQLTEEEKAEILAKREADRIEADKQANLKQFAYNETVADARKSAQKELDKAIEEDKAYVKRYEKAIAKLTAICPDFELISEETEISKRVEIYNGQTIENMNEDGSCNHKCDNWTRSIILDTLTAKGTVCKINYTGATVEGKKYGVTCDTQKRGEYDFNKKEFDTMHVKGSRFDSTEENKHLRNPKTVVDKILEAVKWDFNDQEREIKQNSLKGRALLLAQQVYANSTVELDTYATRSTGYKECDMLVVTLNNGIKINLHFSEATGEIKFTLKEVQNIHTIGVDNLVGALSKISKEA